MSAVHFNMAPVILYAYTGDTQKTENAYVERTAFIYFANVYVVLMKIASESKSEKSFLHTQIDSIL